jgi:hypothetical protein
MSSLPGSILLNPHFLVLETLLETSYSTLNIVIIV